MCESEIQWTNSEEAEFSLRECYLRIIISPPPLPFSLLGCLVYLPPDPSVRTHREEEREEESAERTGESSHYFSSQRTELTWWPNKRAAAAIAIKKGLLA